MDENIKVRVATPKDLDEVMRMAIAGAQENSFMPAKVELILNEVWPAVNQDRGICGIIGEPQSKAQGIVILRIGTVYYSEQLCVEEKIVFVDPAYRAAKGGRARQLCEFSKHVADRLNLPLLIGICSSERTKAKVRLYERIFGAPAGAYFLYKTSTGGHEVTR
jgi:hypothetical protein